MSVINKRDIHSDDPYLGMDIDNYINIMNTTDKIINDEIYDNEENIEEIRNDLKEGIVESKKQAEDIKAEYQENKEEKYNEVIEKISVSFIVNKLKEELEKEKLLKKEERTMSINQLEKNIKLIEDSIKLNIFSNNTYMSKYKIDKEKLNKIIKETDKKLKNTNKYKFASIKEIKSILNKIIKEDNKKYLNNFIYYFCEFILKSKLESHSVYISCIINNIKYLKLFPELEQNKILIDSINNIIEEKFCK